MGLAASSRLSLASQAMNNLPPSRPMPCWAGVMRPTGRVRSMPIQMPGTSPGSGGLPAVPGPF